MGSLEDRLDKDVEGWRPEAGERVFGKVVAVDSRASDYGDDYPYLEIETDNGDVVGVHAFHTVLKNELSRVKPKVGDTIGIKYHGKVVGKRTDAKGKPVEFEKYRVVHESATASYDAPNWDSMSADAAEEAKVSGMTEAFPGLEEVEPF